MASSVDSTEPEGSALPSALCSEDETAAVAKADKTAAAAAKKRRSSVRKPRTKGILKKLQDQVRDLATLYQSAGCSWWNINFWQIEFYFGDANLSKDRFLKQKIDESEDGCEFMLVR